MFTVIYSILAPNGVCVAAEGGGEGGPALPCNSSQQPALFVPSGPPYLPVATASTHHSLTRTLLHFVVIYFFLFTASLTYALSIWPRLPVWPKSKWNNHPHILLILTRVLPAALQPAQLHLEYRIYCT